MKKIQLLITLEYDETTLVAESPEERLWFERHLLGEGVDQPDLILHSNYLGDELGAVMVNQIVNHER